MECGIEGRGPALGPVMSFSATSYEKYLVGFDFENCSMRIPTGPPFHQQSISK